MPHKQRKMAMVAESWVNNVRFLCLFWSVFCICIWHCWLGDRKDIEPRRSLCHLSLEFYFRNLSERVSAKSVGGGQLMTKSKLCTILLCTLYIIVYVHDITYQPSWYGVSCWM